MPLHAREQARLLQNDGPGKNRSKEEKGEDDFGDETGLLQQVAEV